jgi:predicted nucleic acid-binding protein
MILFDSSVILDERNPDSDFHGWSRQQIAQVVSTEGAAINTVVLAETSVRRADRKQFFRHLENIGLVLLPLPVSAALPAAQAYAQYLDRLKAEGKPAKSKIPLGDFFIGAHAQAEGLKLVTRDPSRVATYFPKVKLISP